MIRSRAWLPTPVFSLLLLFVWLLLARSVSPGNIVLGGALAILIPLLTHRFWDSRPRIKKPLKLLRFVLRVLGDIITANFEVAYLIANPWRKLNPHFIEYPLILEDRFTITLLASTISLTPGTVSANLRMDGKSLLIHALNANDEEALIKQIRERYERPLKEIYEC
ncbi:Na+/H+ antiporter subunit E [Vreelandella arcis]|uniref:Multisubunit potassium/proton antiporter, PhaE subunit (TC 2.A.63.1.1) n=1 Tax=Vreelandella arcis TaxID=416873 RepID=A0A1G9ZCH7_9GAMM|nr:Na+/H+ antiporter subunit E [Halomonas arcis]SDN19102.1 multisubunit potassium/proton antiporter, PhaE subunit (TC 2.A.63.1.1) [Halomonas arcis]